MDLERVREQMDAQVGKAVTHQFVNAVMAYIRDIGHTTMEEQNQDKVEEWYILRDKCDLLDKQR